MKRRNFLGALSALVPAFLLSKKVEVEPDGLGDFVLTDEDWVRIKNDFVLSEGSSRLEKRR